MTREAMTRAFGWKNLAAAGVLLVTLLAGALAARQRGDGPRGVAGGTARTISESGLAQGSWLRTVRDDRDGPMLDVHLDAVLAEIGSGVVLDRPALLALVQSVAGADPAIEDKPVADVFGKVSRVRITAQGMSIVLGRRAIVQAVQQVIGRDAVIDEMKVGEVLDAVAGARLTLDGLSGLFDADAALALVGGELPAAQRGASRDPQFARRQALQRQYADVVAMVQQLQRNPRFKGADRNLIYAVAHDRLVAARRLSAVPLLDGHLRLAEELAAAKVGTSSRAERIASRWPARRRAFGDDMADLLFSRDEAMERYEVDRLGLEADPSLSAEQKAQRLRERREALKVELAAQGTFVSFPDETAAAGITDAAGEGRPQ